MLIFSPFECGDQENNVVFNLSSYKEGYYRLNGLNPLNYTSVGISTTYEFDMWYANFLINNPESYKEFIDIMRYLYNGVDVCILVDYNMEFSNLLVDSLTKFILERYGYSANIIRDIEDLEYLKQGEFETSGVILLDRELEDYIAKYGSRFLYTDPY